MSRQPSAAVSGRRRRAHLTLTASLLLIFLAIWIVVPPFSPMWLPLAVAAPELSPWILLAAIVLALIAMLDARIRTPARAALALACLAAALAVWPLVRAARTAPRLAAAMSEGLGKDYLRTVSSNPSRRMRPRPIVVADLFRGIDTGDSRVTRGVTFASPRERRCA